MWHLQISEHPAHIGATTKKIKLPAVWSGARKNGGFVEGRDDGRPDFLSAIDGSDADGDMAKLARGGLWRLPI